VLVTGHDGSGGGGLDVRNLRITAQSLRSCRLGLRGPGCLRRRGISLSRRPLPMSMKISCRRRDGQAYAVNSHYRIRKGPRSTPYSREGRQRAHSIFSAWRNKRLLLQPTPHLLFTLGDTNLRSGRQWLRDLHSIFIEAGNPCTLVLRACSRAGAVTRCGTYRLSTTTEYNYGAHSYEYKFLRFPGGGGGTRVRTGSWLLASGFWLLELGRSRQHADETRSVPNCSGPAWTLTSVLKPSLSPPYPRSTPPASNLP
jgi:hypothetical protein